MSDDLQIGKIAILDFMCQQFQKDSFSWKTVKRWKKNGMPFYYMRNGIPFIKKTEIIKWQLKSK